MASQQEAHNCFETHVGRNMLLVSLVMSAGVLLGAEIVDHATNNDLADSAAVTPTSPLISPVTEYEGVDVPPYMADYPDGTMIFAEGLGALAAVGIIAKVRKRHASRK